MRVTVMVVALWVVGGCLGGNSSCGVVLKWRASTSLVSASGSVSPESHRRTASSVLRVTLATSRMNAVAGAIGRC